MRQKSLLWLACMMAAAGVSAQTEPFRDASLPPEMRARDLVGRMTLDEKIAQMRNAATAVDRLGVPAYEWWNEALHGVARAGEATVFPQPIGMAASFDEQAVRRVFDMVSDEARAKHHRFAAEGQRKRYQGLTFWTPNINIFRDPRWGRGMETYGEDPCLTTRMGLAVVRGLQGEGQPYDKTHACAKHFAVHSGPEWNRHSFDARDISPRDLWETYLPAFRALVQEGDVREVMCAYNRYEGKPCCGSDQLLMRILREEWGFDGIVVSDCGAIRDFYLPGCHETHDGAADASAAAVIAGTDLECGSSYEALAEAVRRGLISEETITESVVRLMTARFQLGMFDDPQQVAWAQIPYDRVECAEHDRMALEMARKSMVLLRNDGVLPIGPEVRRIAVVGANAADSVMLWGNYNGVPTRTVTILEGLRRALPDTEIYYEKGCNLVNDEGIDSRFGECSADGRTGLRATFWNNRTLSGEPAATAHFSAPLQLSTGGNTVFAPGVGLDDFSARFETRFTPTRSEEITFAVAADDGYRLKIDGREVMAVWRNNRNADNYYTMQVERGRSYDIVLEYFQDRDRASLSFDFGLRREFDCAAVARRVAGYDLIIYVGGLSPRLEGEEMRVNRPGFRGGDRTDITLPAIQREMIAALAATGCPLVYVNCSGGAIDLSEVAPHTGAILQAWYAGQQGGTAVADVLTGRYNPAGRLPVTFYASDRDLPDFEDYRMRGRTYRYFDGEPLYPFGHGLSYTTFDYGKTRLSRRSVSRNDVLEVTVPLTNSGSRDGEEVVQLYLRKVGDTDGPRKTLRAWRRVALRAGERSEVTFRLTTADLEWYDPATERMGVVAGEYELLCGGSSADGALQRLPLRIR